MSEILKDLIPLTIILLFKPARTLIGCMLFLLFVAWMFYGVQQ